VIGAGREFQEIFSVAKSYQRYFGAAETFFYHDTLAGLAVQAFDKEGLKRGV
jgi:hypothetical protein